MCCECKKLKLLKIKADLSSVLSKKVQNELCTARTKFSTPRKLDDRRLLLEAATFRFHRMRCCTSPPVGIDIQSSL